MGNPGPPLSKNFQTTYQLDADCCTEFHGLAVSQSANQRKET